MAVEFRTGRRLHRSRQPIGRSPQLAREPARPQAAQALQEGSGAPQKDRLPDQRVGADRPEIATVERIGTAPEEQQLVGSKLPTPAPPWQRASVGIASQPHGHHAPVDAEDCARSAYEVAPCGRQAFDERNACRKITARRGERASSRRRESGDHVARSDRPIGDDVVKADRSAPARVP